MRILVLLAVCLVCANALKGKRRTRVIRQSGSGGGCQYEGKVYQQGQTWTVPCKYDCTCQDGVAGKYQCTEVCPHYDNLPQGCFMVKDPNSCCSSPQCNFQTSGGGATGMGTQGSGQGGSVVIQSSGGAGQMQTATCVDTLSNCKDYDASTCTNPDYAGWVKDNCAKTCNKCGYSSGTSMGQTGGGSMGQTGGGSMGQTGGSTGGGDGGFHLIMNPGTSGSSSCTDKLNNCAAYTQSVCNDQQYNQWVLQNCPAFCNKCGMLTSSTGTMTGTGTGSGGSIVIPVIGGGSMTGSGTYPNSGTGSGSYPNSGTGSGSYPNSGTGSGSYPNSGTGSGSYPMTGTGSGTYPNTGTGSGIYPNTGTGAYPNTGTGSVMYPNTGTGTGTYPSGTGGTGTGGYPSGTSGTGTGGYPSGTGGTGTGTYPSGTSGTGTGGYPSGTGGTGTGTYPSGTGGTGTGTYPSGTGGTGTGTYPGGTGGTGTGTYPSGSGGTGTGTYPSGSGGTGTGTYPSGTGGTGTGTYPGGTGGTGTGTYPSGSGGTGTGTYPSGTGGTGTGSYPDGTGGSGIGSYPGGTGGSSGTGGGVISVGGSGYGSCADRISNCAAYGQSVCTDATYAGWVKDNCAKTCNKCSGGTMTSGTNAGSGYYGPGGSGMSGMTGSGTGSSGVVTGHSNGCAYKGQAYQQGQTWKDGCDYRCTCTDGSQGRYSCQQLCVTWNLPSDCHLEPAPAGKCCRTPSCPGTVNLHYPPNYVAE